MEFKETDIEIWMKAVNIDVYWEHFKAGGIDNGEALRNVDINTLNVRY